MNDLILLTDGSVNAKSKVGYGAYLAISEIGLSIDLLASHVKLRRFENTSSTKLELQTLLWALGDIPSSVNKVTVYTDCQNTVGLVSKRDRFEKNNYRSKRNKRLNNYELYQIFFKMTDRLDFNLVKLRGHPASDQKNDFDKIFTLVDRAARNALREDHR